MFTFDRTIFYYEQIRQHTAVCAWPLSKMAAITSRAKTLRVSIVIHMARVHAYANNHVCTKSGPTKIKFI